MISLDDALARAAEYLQRRYPGNSRDLVIITEMTRKEEFGWVFFFNSRVFLETKDINDALGGNAPIIVDRDTGEVHETGTALPIEHYIDDFRKRRVVTRNQPY